MSTPSIEEILEIATKLPTPQERAAYLRGACGENQDLRQQIDSLLDAQDQAPGFLPTDPGGESITLPDRPLAEGPGTTIGRYKILQLIAEGGMGAVFMAEQTEPVRRKVALKIIKLGMDTKNVIARFEAERQALALMDHPNIAKVLDAGATETGRPYFVMELVKGVPISTYCDKNSLSAKERLELFIPVCQAIQHAHHKGVIHRDIKPSNILVTLNEGVPHPMVIDFGIAKATNQRLTEKTLFTNYAQMIGTPAYMSPEQAEMSKLDVDTRSDIYSLGVVLYELLTGSTPFPEKELLSKGYGEMQRIISEQEPERPSLRLSTLVGEQQTIVTKNRADKLSALTQQIRGDVDWIVMKSLEKDRTRRYETVNNLAEDIQRYLRNEAVSAARPSFRYQIVKTYHRNKPAFAAGFAIAAILIVSSIVSTALAIRAQREEQKSLAAKETAETLNDFVFGELIGLADPENNAQRSLTLLDALDQIEEQISQNFSDRPELEIEARLALGRAFVFRFDSERSAKHLKRAYELSREQYGDADLRTLIAGRMYVYSWLSDRPSRIPENVYQTIIPRLFHSATTLFEPSDPHYYMCHMIEVWRLNESRDMTQSERWTFLSETQKHHQAIRETDPIQAALNLLELGGLKHRMGDYAGAKPYLRSALDEFIQDRGESFPLTLLTRRAMANALIRNREFDRAIDELETVLANGKDVFLNPNFLTSISGSLAGLFFRLGDEEKAEALAQQITSDTASEFNSTYFLIMSYWDSAMQLTHQEAKETKAWSRCLEGLLSLAEFPDGSRTDGLSLGYSIAECHYFLGNRDEQYDMMKRLKPSAHNLTIAAMNRAAVGDWQLAYEESLAALRQAEIARPGKVYVYPTVVSALTAINLGKREAWIESCRRLVPELPQAGFNFQRALFACLGQRERLPEDLEKHAIEIAESRATQAMGTNLPGPHTNQIIAGGLVAWRRGEYRKAIEILNVWPYQSQPLTDSSFSRERYRFRGEASQHLLIANCYAQLNQIENAKKHLKLCDKVYEPIHYDWWAPLVLTGLRTETETLIATAK